MAYRCWKSHCSVLPTLPVLNTRSILHAFSKLALFQMAPTQDILFEDKGHAGIVTLNKPETLNAVTDTMLTALNAQLDVWERDDKIKHVVIKAVEGRAFSAGGDIRHLYDTGTKGNFDFDFFAREYALNARIRKFPKPYIALVDGIVMGGGVGVSFHGSHRIAGNGIAFAMPEVGIGFFPDVGASYFLSRLPHHMGLYLGLTGSRMKTADCVALGLATHYVPSDQFADLETALCEEDIATAIERHAQPAETAPYLAYASYVERAFAGLTLQDVFSELNQMQNEGGDTGAWAAKTLATLEAKSPTSLAIAFHQIRMGIGKDMDECMKMEFRILKRILTGNEFYEGIRAAIIDKDNMPVWNPASLASVDQSTIDAHFADLGEEELNLQ